MSLIIQSNDPDTIMGKNNKMGHRGQKFCITIISKILF